MAASIYTGPVKSRRVPLGARASRPSPASAGVGQPSPQGRCVASLYALIPARLPGRARRPRSQDFSQTLSIYIPAV